MAAASNFPQIPVSWSETSDLIDNGRLFVRLLQKKTITPERKPRLLFIVHGQGEQQDRYEHFPFYLENSIDAIALFDLPGHGQSAGIRGHIQSFDQYSNAALLAFQHSYEKIRLNWPATEAIWFGHSLGGLITLRTLLKKKDLPLKGVAVSAPLLGLAFAPPPLKKFFAILTEPILGRVPLANELNANELSHDSLVADAYLKNPLNHAKITPRFFVRMSREIELLKAPNEEFSYSLLMITPLADRIVSWQSQFRFLERVKMSTGKNKELQSFPNLFHESFNETEKERVFVCLETWINKLK